VGALVVVGSLCLIPLPPAGASSGVVFATAQPVSAPWKEFKRKGAKRVPVCNGSRGQARKLNVAVTGFGFRHNQRRLANSNVIRVRVRPRRLLPGRCGAVLLRAVRGAKIDAGSYSGAIAVTARGAGVARLELITTRSETVATKPAAVDGAIEQATLELVNDAPLRGAGSREVGDLLLQPPPPGEPALSLGEGCEMRSDDEGSTKACPLIGNLYKGTEVVHVYIAGPATPGEGVERLPVRIDSDNHLVGDYEGMLDPGLSGEEDQMVNTKLIAKDSLCAAIAAIFLGALLALGVQLYSDRIRPTRRIKRQAEAIVDVYRRGRTWDPKKRNIEVDMDAVLNYSEDVKASIRQYMWSVLMVDKESEAFKQIKESIDLAEADARKLIEDDGDGLRTALDSLEDEVRKAREMLADTYSIAETPAMLARATAPLGPGLLKVGGATERTKTARELAPLLREWRYMTWRVLSYEVWLIALDINENTGKPRKITPTYLARLRDANLALKELRFDLFRASTSADLDRMRRSHRVEDTFAKLSALGGKYRVGAPNGPEDVKDVLERTAGVKGRVDPKLADRTPDKSAKEVDWAEWWMRTTPTSPAKIPEKRFWWLAGDIAVLLVSVITAVIAGLTLFYFGKSFGTFEDYLTVIFAGTATQALLKVILDNLSYFMHDISVATNAEPPTATIAPKPT
jgi:hypothetical protein